MRKGVVLLLCLNILILPHSLACTTFFINKNGQLVFGRNYDWVSAAGIVCTNLEGLHKTSMKNEAGKTISWISTYGSITFNQYGKEFPTGGMNESGLVVELMWAEGSQYPREDHRPVLGVLQWIQYQLDNNKSVEEVIATDAKVRISPKDPPLHYLVADASGNAAVIEFLKGKMVVHTGRDLPFPVLTNNSYNQSEKAARDAHVLLGDTSFKLHDNSLQRFAKACSMVQLYQQGDIKKTVIDYAFDILNAVSQEGFTKWSIVYDLKNKKLFFKTADYRDIKSFTFDSFKFSCNSTPEVLDMNQPMQGDIGKKFTPFNGTINRTIMERAITESRSQVPISDKEKEDGLAYADAIKCKQ